MDRILITGASGCIGQATVAWLRGRGVEEIVGMTRSGDAEGIESVTGDVSERSDVEAAVKKVGPTHIIHLAAFQSPDCQAQPFRGMEINVGGTENLLRAAAATGGGNLKRVVFASSAAVYGPRDIYPGGTVKEGDPCRPPNLYGFWKVAGEGMMQAFHSETDVSAISLRLATTFGPGRDRGMTAAPTTAIKAVALGVPYAIPYFGREHYHFVDDVGAAFGACAAGNFSGCEVFNLRGTTVEVAEFVNLVEECAAAQGIEGTEITIAEKAEKVPFVCDLDDEAIVEAFPEMPLTGLKDGVSASLKAFRKEVEEDVLTGVGP